MIFHLMQTYGLNVFLSDIQWWLNPAGIKHLTSKKPTLDIEIMRSRLTILHTKVLEIHVISTRLDGQKLENVENVFKKRAQFYFSNI